MPKLVVGVTFFGQRFEVETELSFVPDEDDMKYLANEIKSSIEAKMMENEESYILNGRLPK